ncbi:MAG: hypothetical protein LBI85_05475 [Spirochaetaceae bacterium]|jgi:hypothetical protein|nr:hypothetical protein [Spirochaetaceae bacterium]
MRNKNAVVRTRGLPSRQARCPLSIVFMARLLALGLVFSACACSPSAAPERILGLSTETPVFLGYRVLSGGIMEFSFSRPVSLSCIDFDPPLDTELLEAELLDAGGLVRLRFEQGLPGGSRVSADLLVADEEGNTLEVLIPFRTRNDSLPVLVINEIRTEYSNPRCEFIELKTSTPGNLGALRVMTAIEAEPIYEFEPVEVGEGEYIVLHLRKTDNASLDETGDDLEASEGYEASGARDFWIPGNTERLRKTDGIALVDQDGTVLDGIIFSETSSGSWAKENLARFAGFLNDAGAWKPSGDPPCINPSEAFSSQGSTATQTLCRDELVSDSNDPHDWYIAARNQATPGRENSTKRYEP